MSHRSFDDPDSIEARQALLDNRCEHATKRHRVRKRAAQRKAVARRKAKQRLAAAMAGERKFHAAVRAYWSGDVGFAPGRVNAATVECSGSRAQGVEDSPGPP